MFFLSTNNISIVPELRWNYSESSNYTNVYLLTYYDPTVAWPYFKPSRLDAAKELDISI